MTFQSYPTVNMISQEGTSPIVSTVASTSRVTARISQQNMTSVPLSLPSFLIPTGTVGVSTTSNATAVGGEDSSILK